MYQMESVSNGRKRVVILGVGYWGFNYFREMVMQADQSWELVATVDPKIESPWSFVMNKKDELCHHFARLEDVPYDFHAAIVATPAHTHVDVTRALLARGVKHILLEKPAATCTADVTALANMVADAGAVITVGHTYMWNRPLQYMLQASTLDVGDLLYVYTRRTNLGPVRTDVPVHWDLATHDLSILQRLMQFHDLSFTRVCHAAWGNSATRGTVFFTVEYGNADGRRVRAHLHVSWEEPHKERLFSIVGKNGKLVFDEMASPDLYTRYDTSGSSDCVALKNISPPLREQLRHWLFAGHVVQSAPHGCSIRDAANITKILECADELLALNSTYDPND